MAEEHRPYTASYLVLEKDDEVLLLKRQNTGYRDGMYSLVAGHVDEGENFRQAMIREAEEEVGIEIKEEDLETATVMHRESEGRTYIDIFFRATEWNGEVENMEPEKCANLSWFKKDNLPDNTLGYVERVTNTLEDGMTYEERGWD
ncbi:MAG: NUDIX domain-containing protein [Candidatus Aenigmatarchaeota archaeon]